MSLLIEGIGAPKNCAACDYSMYVELWNMYCKLVCKKEKTDIASKRRADFCPMKEIKEPHGDLVDKDKLMLEIMDSDLDHLQRDDWREVIQIVADAPTIIESEGSE